MLDKAAGFGIEEFDYGSCYNTGTYTFTTPVTGIYDFRAKVHWDTLNAGDRASIRFYKNGSTVISEFRGRYITTNEYYPNVISEERLLTAGDTVVLQAYHNKGDNTPVIKGSSNASFSVASITLVKEI